MLQTLSREWPPDVCDRVCSCSSSRLLASPALAQDPRGEMVNSLLQALTSSEIQLPPVDFSSVLIPFCRNRESSFHASVSVM